MNKRRIQLCCLVACSIIVTIVSVQPDSALTSAPTPTPDNFRRILETRVQLAPRASRAHQLEALDPEKVYSFAFSIPAPENLRSQDRIAVTIRDRSRSIVTKTIHVGDPDLYTLFRPRTAGATITVSGIALALAPIEYRITVLEWPGSTSATTTIEAEPNDSWREANQIALGQTVWAGADDKPYILPLGQEDEARGRAPYQQKTSTAQGPTHDRLPEGGIDWFTFNYDSEKSSLVFFEVELPERDNIPVDVSVYKIEDGEAKLYERGSDPVSPPHEVQALPGNKFTTRTVSRGTYYIRVDANHPFYQLRTSIYEPPPYSDPGRAVRAGVDYLLSAGDSWHANTPRHGGIVNRVSNIHAETSTCIACHATHFTTRGALIAKQNGYPIEKRPQLQFLTERLYNNPRPFYGHPDASWSRVISAAANVSSRLAALLNLYETEVSGERRVAVLKGVGGYLKIYYKGRMTLPKDESNGNTPLVSTYEVAFYSWRVFDELYRQTGDEESRQYRDQVRGLLEEDQHKNVIDLCYQTIALATIDRVAYADKIRRNSERLLSLQRADGQWSMLFESDSPAVEFQTGQSLYALALAGYSRNDPRILKGLKFLLTRQQEFGGWFDPRQSYENFRTPFRETQFAVMALSEFYKGPVAAHGWNAGPFPKTIADNDPRVSLEKTDGIWENPGQSIIGELRGALGSAEALVRLSAAVALGRTGGVESLGPLVTALDDPQKSVQIAAARAIRQIAERNQAGFDEISRAMKSTRGRARWGATRIFSQHFSALTQRRELAERLILLETDPLITVRMQATKALSQWFYWTRDVTLRDRIADTFVARMAVREHPWMRRNLLEGFYSIADENVRYLYDNWIALIAEPGDRERAIRGHRDASQRMAERIARGLIAGNELQREGLLEGLTEFHLRTGDSANAGRYTRIGNDTETVRFYQEGATALEGALVGMLRSPKAERRKQAIIAAYTLRETQLLKLPLLVMERLADTDAAVRDVSEEFYRTLPLKVEQSNRGRAIATLRKLLTSDRDEAKIAALDRVGVLDAESAARAGFAAGIKALVTTADSRVAPAALRALGGFPELVRDPTLQERVAAALSSSELELQRAGVQLVLKRAELRSLRPIAAALDTLFQSADPARRRMILSLITVEYRVEDDLRLLNLIVESLRDRDEQVRLSALGLVRRVNVLQSNPAVRAAVALLMKDANERIQGQAIALYQGADAAKVAIDGRDAGRVLDYQFFVRRVMPILERKGADGNACVNCHSTHAIFRLQEPGPGGYTEERLRENYTSALKVVDLSTPESSFILRKPISNPDQEGVVGAKKLSHGGGQRWVGTDDPSYRTILEWINGARIERE
ncbi:MAG: hypothetical protein ABI882_07970 [Acidobacteriota bacterium]